MKKKKVLSLALATFMAASNLSVPGNFISERRIVKAETQTGMEQLRKLQFCVAENQRVIVKLEKSLESIYDSLRYDIESKEQDNCRKKQTFDKLTKEQVNSDNDIKAIVGDNDWNQYVVLVTTKKETGNSSLGPLLDSVAEQDTFSVYFDGKQEEKLSFTIKRVDEINEEEAKKIKQVLGELAIQGLQANIRYELKKESANDYKKVRTDEKGILKQEAQNVALAAGKYYLRKASDDWISFGGEETEKDYLYSFATDGTLKILKQPASLTLNDLKDNNKFTYSLEKEEEIYKLKVWCPVKDTERGIRIDEVGYKLGDGEFTKIWSKEDLMKGKPVPVDGPVGELFTRMISLNNEEVNLSFYPSEQSSEKLTFEFAKEKVAQISVNDKTLTGFGTDFGRYRIREVGEIEEFVQVSGNEHTVTNYGVYEVKKLGTAELEEYRFAGNENKKTITWDSDIKKIHVVDPTKKITEENLKALTYKVEGDILVVGNLQSLGDSLGELTYKISGNSGEPVNGEIDYTISLEDRRISGIGAGKTFEINATDNEKLSITFTKEDMIDNSNQRIKQADGKFVIAGIESGEANKIEYKKSTENKYKNVQLTEGNLNVDSDGEYQLRKKGTEGINFTGTDNSFAYKFPSDPISVSVEKFNLPKSEIKKLSFTVDTEKKNLVIGKIADIANRENYKPLKYKTYVDAQAGSEMEVALTEATKTISAIDTLKKIEVYSTDNDKLTIKFEKEAKVQAGTIKQTDGKIEIQGIPEGYEYRKAGESTYQSVNPGMLVVDSLGDYFFRKKGSETKTLDFQNGDSATYKLPSDDVKVTVEGLKISKETLKNLSFTVKDGKLTVGNLKSIDKHSKDLKYKLADGQEQKIDFTTENEAVIAGIAASKTLSLYEGDNKIEIIFGKEVEVDAETKKNVKQFEKELAIAGIKETEASNYEISAKKGSDYKDVELVELGKNKTKVVKVKNVGTHYIRRKSTTPTIQFGNEDSFTYKLPSDVIAVVLKSKIQDAPSYFPEVSVEPKKEEPKKEEPKKEEPKKEEPKKEQSKEEITQKETVKEVVEVAKSAKKNKITVKEDKIQNVLESENGSLKVSLKNLGLTFSKETLRNFVQDMAKKFDVGLKIVTLKKSTKGKTGKDYSLASRKNFKVTLKVDGKSADELDLQGKKVKVSLSVKLKNQKGKLYVMDLKTGKKHSAKYKNGKLTFATDKLGSFVVVKRQAKKKV